MKTKTNNPYHIARPVVHQGARRSWSNVTGKKGALQLRKILKMGK